MHEISEGIDGARILAALTKARGDLLAERHPDGHWTGELASSPLSTATAVAALALFERHLPAELAESAAAQRLTDLIVNGLAYLAGQQRSDGGWGDTDQSLSNIATTMLARSAFGLTFIRSEQAAMLAHADAYLAEHGGISGIFRRYGRDRTFAAPILATAAMAGIISWREVPTLPFELAWFPQSFWKFLRLPVVSYAIPALVAIGQARYHHAPPWNPLSRLIRRLAIGPTLDVLHETQPDSGGYLEAIPLTSFVVMSLAAIGRSEHPVCRRGVEFLISTVRPDGSWPIDVNLATWTTSLAMNALAAHVPQAASTDEESGESCVRWLLSCQHRSVHPFTGAEPGGWAWTDLSGGVPDADDTPGAILALIGVHQRWTSASSAATQDNKRVEICADIREATTAGVVWLLNLQNRDGGWPTFCRGWGKLPFDRSGADLTAHAIRALIAWRAEILPAMSSNRLRRAALGGLDAVQLGRLDRRVDAALDRGLGFLLSSQQRPGTWAPLWFGNQNLAGEQNLVYGGSRVLLAFRDLLRLNMSAARRGIDALLEMQNLDGGWGAAAVDPWSETATSSVEETALAVEALVSCGVPVTAQPLAAGVAWLVKAVESDRHRVTSPIGFYFAKLWYYEKLYPLIYSVAALAQVAKAARVDAEEPKR